VPSLLLRSAKYGAADEEGDDHACEIGGQAGEDGMTGPANADGAKVNGEDVEGGLRAAEDGTGGAGDEAVRAVRFNQLCEEAEGGAAAEGADENDGQQVRREANPVEDRGEPLCEYLDAASGAEHADGNEDGDEVGNDPDGDVEAVLGTFDELLVDLYSTGEGVKGEKGDEKRDGKRGGGGDSPNPYGGLGEARLGGVGGGRGMDNVADEPVDEAGGEKCEDRRAPAAQRGWGRGIRILVRRRLGSLRGGCSGSLRYGEGREALKELYSDDGGGGGATGCDKGGADDGGGVGGFCGSEDDDGGGGDELNGTGIDGEEGAHRIGGGAGVGIEALKALHGAKAERGGGVAEAEHVRGDIHDHGAHGGMIGGDIREQPAQDGAQYPGEDLDEAGLLSEAHDSQPQGHAADEGEGDGHHARLGGIEGAVGELLHVAGGAAHQYRGEDEPEPDVVEHTEGLREAKADGNSKLPALPSTPARGARYGR